MASHLAWPVQLVGGSLAVLDQDSDDDITQCIEIIVATHRGERVELRGFGITDPTFAISINTGEIEAAVAEWEPRADHVTIAETINRVDEAARTLTIERRRGSG